MSKLREIRKSKGMTQLELSIKSEVSIVTISKIETNKDYDLTLSTAKKLSRALGGRLSELFSEE